MADEMKNGDIFRWRYKDEIPSDLGSYRRYHCKSQIAVFANGTLRDTYWCGSYEGYVNRDDVVLDFQGNENEMEAISPGYRVFYRPEDIMDMNHPNNSRAPVYVKVWRKRDAETMKAYFERAIERSKYEISSLERRIAESEECLAAIDSGDLSRHFPVYA